MSRTGWTTIIILLVVQSLLLIQAECLVAAWVLPRQQQGASGSQIYARGFDVTVFLQTIRLQMMQQADKAYYATPALLCKGRGEYRGAADGMLKLMQKFFSSEPAVVFVKGSLLVRERLSVCSTVPRCLLKSLARHTRGPPVSEYIEVRPMS